VSEREGEGYGGEFEIEREGRRGRENVCLCVRERRLEGEGHQ